MSTVSTPTGAPLHIQAILEGARHCFGTLFGDGAAVDTPALVPAQALDGQEVNVLVGFTEDLVGQILLSMPREVAFALSTHMMGGQEVNAFDELTHSILAELGNMTAGACSTQLTSHGIKTNITCPTVIIGQHLQLSWPQLYIIRAPIVFPFGNASLAIGLKVASKPA